MIALGRALLAAGHRVRFATTPFFKEDIETAGVEFLRLPPDWGAEDFARAMRTLHRAGSPLRQLRLIYGGAKPYMAETLKILDQALTEADILVGSYLFPSFRGLADRRGTKFAVVSFAHNCIATPDFPPDVVPRLDFLTTQLRRTWNRLWWGISERVLDGVMETELGGELHAAGLPMQKGFCSQPAGLALVAVSPALMRPEADFPPCFRFTGYLRHQSPHNPALEQTLQAFTDGQRVPVITFGSVTWDKAQESMRVFLEHWPADKKLILQAGWANFGSNASLPHVLNVRKCSHDQLFRHASVIMHHGGAGTTASALHAGVPQLVAPQIADQNFWASQVMRLGVGTRASTKGWPTQAPRLLQKLAADEKVQNQARAHADTLSLEDGGEAAVKALEDFLREA